MLALSIVQKIAVQFEFDCIDFNLDRMEDMMQLNFTFGFRPIYYFARICGQMPFTIIYHRSNGAIVGTKFFKCDFIWSAISLCMQIAFIRFAMDLLTSPRDPNQISATLHFCNIIIWFLTVLFGISMMVLDTHNRWKIVGILKEFVHFDNEVDPLISSHNFYRFPFRILHAF